MLSRLYLIQSFAVFLLYFITATIGLLLDPVGGFASLVWAPSGIALASVVLFGFKIWPAIFLAAFLVNFNNGAIFPVASGIGFGNTLEPVVGAYLLKKITKFNHSLSKLKDVLGLIIFGAVFSTLVSASIGTTSLLFGGVIDINKYLNTWFAWWVGDMLGNLVVAPLLLIWVYNLSVRIEKIKFRNIAEAILLFILLEFLTLILFTDFFSINLKSFPITHLMFPLLIWLSLRFGQIATVTAIFIISIIAIVGTISGHGVFIRERLSESLFLLQSFLGVSATTFLVLSAVSAERKALVEQKDNFLSIASHELRTPITTIKGYVDLLNNLIINNSAKNSKIKTYVLRIDQQIKSLIKLISELLDATRIESDKIKLNYETFLINQLILDIVKDFSQTHDKHKIEIDCKTNQLVTADRERISQVIINLISNAIKFSSISNKIIVKVVKQPDEVVVSVKDFGVGIKEVYLSEIFKRFYQVSQDKKASSAGLGLGLYISSEIIKQHGGKIWVESKIGKGSTFSFSLPIKE